MDPPAVCREAAMLRPGSPAGLSGREPRRRPARPGATPAGSGVPAHGLGYSPEGRLGVRLRAFRSSRPLHSRNTMTHRLLIAVAATACAAVAAPALAQEPTPWTGFY